MAVLRDPALAAVPAKMSAEIQCTLNAMKEAKKYMQLPYAIAKAPSDLALYTDFAGNTRGWDEADATNLCHAAYKGQLDVVQKLLDSGSDPNEVDAERNGSSAVYIAASNNHPDIVGLLLSAGADSNKPTTDNSRTPLYQAAKFGHVDVLKQLIAGDAHVDKPKRTDGATPLMMAAQQGHLEAARTLIAAGAVLDKGKTMDESTALFLAADNGRLPVVKTLVKHGASMTKHQTSLKITAGVNMVKGKTPLAVAKEKGHEEVHAFLVSETTKQLATVVSEDGDVESV